MQANLNHESFSPRARDLLNRVPEVTLVFWIIKILSTTVGETAADFLSVTLNLGLTLTSVVMAALLAVALVNQFRLRRYVPAGYWTVVVLISIVGTLITDNLTDNLGISLVTTTSLFAIALVAVLSIWYASERTLAMKSIDTPRREAFYWAAILCTFALGTAAGDLLSEGTGLGYGTSLMVFAGLLAMVFIAHFGFRLNPVIAFWVAYVLTRPLGAAAGDYLSQPTADGGLGLGTVFTSVLFLIVIVSMVTWLSVQQDRTQTRLPATQ